jgi:hypothetical protein
MDTPSSGAGCTVFIVALLLSIGVAIGVGVWYAKRRLAEAVCLAAQATNEFIQYLSPVQTSIRNGIASAKQPTDKQLKPFSDFKDVEAEVFFVGQPVFSPQAQCDVSKQTQDILHHISMTVHANYTAVVFRLRQGDAVVANIELGLDVSIVESLIPSVKDGKVIPATTSVKVKVQPILTDLGVLAALGITTVEYVKEDPDPDLLKYAVVNKQGTIAAKELKEGMTWAWTKAQELRAAHPYYNMFELVNKKGGIVLCAYTCHTFTVSLLRSLHAKFDVRTVDKDLDNKLNIVVRVPLPCAVTPVAVDDAAAVAYAKKISRVGTGLLSQLQSLLTIIRSLPTEFVFGYTDSDCQKGGLFRVEISQDYTKHKL